MTYKKYSADEIIRGIRHHDSAVLEFIYLNYFPATEAYVLHHSGSTEQAKDVFQESMIIAYRKIREPGFSLTCKFGTYLYAICKNVWIQERKKHLLHTEKLRQQPLQVNEPGGDEDPLMRKHLDELFSRHFSQLSEDCRKILTMFFNHFSVEEIRDAMNYKDIHHAADRKYRCKKSLIKRITNDPFFKKLKDEQR
jgi:RNA polymerase sigma factor (sigma-70 family)